TAKQKLQATEENPQEPPEVHNTKILLRSLYGSDERIESMAPEQAKALLDTIFKVCAYDQSNAHRKWEQRDNDELALEAVKLFANGKTVTEIKEELGQSTMSEVKIAWHMGTFT